MWSWYRVIHQTSTLAIVDRSITNNLKTSSEAHILKKKLKYRHYEEEDSLNISLQRDSRFFMLRVWKTFIQQNHLQSKNIGDKLSSWLEEWEGTVRWKATREFPPGENLILSFNRVSLSKKSIVKTNNKLWNPQNKIKKTNRKPLNLTL